MQAFVEHWNWNLATHRLSGRQPPRDGFRTLGRSDGPAKKPSSAIRCARVPTSFSASYLMAVNRDTEAESALRKALELGPGGSYALALGRGLLLQGENEAALREMQQEKEEIWRLTGLPLVFNALGRGSESDAAFAALKSKYGGEMAYQIAEVHAFRGEADLAFEWLERAYDQRDGGVVGYQGRPAVSQADRRSALQGVSEEAEAARVMVTCD